MTRFLILIVVLFDISSSQAQHTSLVNKCSEEYNLGFEVTTDNDKPLGWLSYNRKNGYKVGIDSTEKHGGKHSLLIEKVDLQDQTYGAQSIGVIPAKYEGKEIEVKAYMKLESVSGFIDLGVAIDDEDYDRIKYVSLDNKKYSGTKEWRQYSIKIPLSKYARYIRIWPTLVGAGKLWIDDIQILIDGKDISLARLKPSFDLTSREYIPYGNNLAKGAYIKVREADLYYETYGKGEPLLLLHGNSQSIYAFKKQIIELSKHYKVIAVDTRGQGKSTDLSSTALSYNLFAEDMKTLLDSLHIPKTNILGWSDGGNTGLIMAFKYPAYVNKLAVMGANMFPTDQAVRKSILKEVGKTIGKLKTKSDDKSKMQVRLYTMLLNEPNITVENLKGIEAPVLVMAGEKDMILEKHTKYIADQIPSSQLYIFKGATHYAPVEVVSEFNNRVMRFFRVK